MAIRATVARIRIDLSLYHTVGATFTLTQNTHTTTHNPIQITAFPTAFPSLTLETSPTASKRNAIMAPSLLLQGTKSITPHKISSTPTNSRSVLEFIEDVLRSWTICSGVIGELSLAMPAERTVKDRMRAERRERREEKDMVKRARNGW